MSRRISGSSTQSQRGRYSNFRSCFYSASPLQIFSSVIGCSANLCISDEEVLAAGITALGGQWRSNDLTRDVTHLFTDSMSSERYSTGMNHRDQKHCIKVLAPDWFDDSVCLGIRDLSTDTYEWPNVATQEVWPPPRPTAWRDGKPIGTLSWLLYVNVTGVFSSPSDQILHFPILPGVVKGFKKHKISITNYTGEGREYLKKLISLMGGTFTLFLSPQHTILIAAHVDFATILGERGVGTNIEKMITAEAARESADEQKAVGRSVPPIKQASILNVPFELWAIIAGSLSRKSLPSLCVVSRHFCSIFSVLLYRNILNPLLTIAQSSRLIKTLRNEPVPICERHWSTMIYKLALECNCFKTPEVETRAASDALHKLTSPSVLAGLDELAQILGTGHVPNLTELFVRTNDSSKNFNFIQIGGLEVLGLEIHFDIGVMGYCGAWMFQSSNFFKFRIFAVELAIGQKLCYKLAEAIQMLLCSSPLLHTFRLNLVYPFYPFYPFYEVEFPYEAFYDLLDTINHMHLPALATLDFSLDLKDDNDGLCHTELVDLPNTDFSPFLTSHPNLVDLALSGTETELTEDITFLPRLHAFKGTFQAAVSICAHQRQLERLELTFILPYFCDMFHELQTLPLPTHLTLRHLRVLALDKDGSAVKLTNGLSQIAYTNLVSSFPNLTHLEICLDEQMMKYRNDFLHLKNLQQLRIQQYRTTSAKLTPPSRPITKIFPPRNYIDKFKPWMASLLQLTCIEICVLADRIHQIPEYNDNLFGLPPQIKIDCSFSRIPKPNGDKMVLRSSRTTNISSSDKIRLW
ncbi:hypothetical protein DFH07DRAFT_768115 [Mycena maculata]|uniref:BRCT domain-containing protein n=1 Tax=Mycena maculata TaxID=230809 RepID=A0AAD7NRL7_9AGAR|nr:hypothetical protein DFH07DRAFT_768115 [Mycena maculata]